MCCLAALTLTAGIAIADSEYHAAGWREDFRTQPPGWEIRRKPGAALADFRIEPAKDGHDGALVMIANDQSGMFATSLDHIDLRRTPILRWRWRATVLPTGGDGRVRKRDDQAIAIYVSAGGLFRQRSIAYRWETDTPVGTAGDSSYAAGIVKTKWFALRNAEDKGSFFVEERNVARDFQRAFGFVPEEVNVGVTCNSQYTGTSAAAELDWIELVAVPHATPESPAKAAEDP
jgi:Protein of unknown function (DUF3047)